MNTPKTPRSIVKLAFPQSIPGLIAVAKAVAQGLKGNASFPNPDPTVVAIEAAIADLEVAHTAALTRTKGAVETRNEKRAALVELLQQLKVFVQKVLDANREHAPALAQSVSMGVRRRPTPHKRTFAAKQGKLSGTVDLVTARAATRRASYEWEVSADGGKTWQMAPPTFQSRTTILGLSPGGSYSFRVRAVTKAGPGNWSEPTALVVN